MSRISASSECTVQVPAVAKFTLRTHGADLRPRFTMQAHKHKCSMQVHGVGGTIGVIFYSLMASKNYVYELYGESLQKAPDLLRRPALPHPRPTVPYPTLPHLTLPHPTLPHLPHPTLPIRTQCTLVVSCSVPPRFCPATCLPCSILF